MEVDEVLIWDIIDNEFNYVDLDSDDVEEIAKMVQEMHSDEDDIADEIYDAIKAYCSLK